MTIPLLDFEGSENNCIVIILYNTISKYWNCVQSYFNLFQIKKF